MAIDLSRPVLVVDDYPMMIRIIRNYLNQLGFRNIEEARDGREGLAKLNAGEFGFVISDWKMAPMDGLELLERVRASDRLKTLPFIMITAESNTDKVIAAREAGVSTYIVKPLNADTFRTRLMSVLESSDSRRQ